MHEGAQLVAARQLLHRLALPDGLVARDQIADRRRQQEEAAIDPAAVVVRLLLEIDDPVALDRSAPKRFAPAAPP